MEDIKNKFLEKRHKKFQTPEKIIFDLVKKATGLTPTEKKKFVRGYANECYAVKTKGKKEFIVRINQFGGQNLSRKHG